MTDIASMAIAKQHLPTSSTPGFVAGASSPTDQADASVIVRRATPDLFILDADLRVIATSPGAAWLLDASDPAPARELAEAVRRALREPLPDFASAELQTTHVAIEDLFGETILLRVVPLYGAPEGQLAVFSERLQLRDPISRAATHFNLSPRERDVLREVMLGRGTTQIAESLGIAETTVADHIKRISMKTDAHRRSEIIARVLGTR